MNAIFRVANRLRQAAPIPRDFLPISGLEHLGLTYKKQIISDPAEFNDTLARIKDPRFPRRGATIEPYMLTADDEAKLAAAAEKKLETFTAPPLKEESVTETSEPVTDQAPAEETVTPDTQPAETSEPTDAPIALSLRGKSIYIGDERVAGLYGEEKQLRVFKEELREAVQSFLNENPPQE